MRTEIKIELRCSRCGDTLVAADPPAKKGDGYKSWFDYDSAHEIEAHIGIEPCARCMAQAKAPVEMIRQALAAMNLDER